MNNFTIVNSMQEHALQKPDEIAFRYINSIDDDGETLSYLELYNESRAVANFIKGIAEPGSCILLFFPPGIEYVKAFYGCLMAGMIAVPLYPPRKNAKSNRVVKVVESCGTTVALTTVSELEGVSEAWSVQNTEGHHLDFYSLENVKYSGKENLDEYQVSGDDVAFLQYTSGSTGAPKGVTITHNNIIANLEHLSLMSGGCPEDIFVNWLPLFHDLGLITAILWPVFLGAPSTLMAPATFVREPSIWLKAINKYRGSMCGAPNFAYDLCSKKVSDADMEGLDLSCWRVAYNAAEPVRARTLSQFTERFSNIGFKSEAFYPGYGMAEATVLITGGKSDCPPVVLNADKQALSENKIELSTEEESTAKLVGCGTALPPHDVRVVDPESGKVLQDGHVGEIWFSGPSVSIGYWKKEELNRVTFEQTAIEEDMERQGYLRTGDLGVMYEGELFVTGRMKDLIILKGKNFYPQDIELSAAESNSAIRPGQIAAFSISDAGREQLVVVAELDRNSFKKVDKSAVIHGVRENVFADHEINVDRVILLKPYTIPMTSSGKIQRKQTKSMLENNEFEYLADSGVIRFNDYVAPRNQVETDICAIWMSVLEAENVGVTDDFFDVGGDSIAAIAISTEVKKHFDNIEIDRNKLLEFSTVEKMASWIELTLNYRKSNGSSFDKDSQGVLRI